MDDTAQNAPEFRSHDDDVAFIQALADVLRSHDLSELEVKRETGKDQQLNIRLGRAITSAPVAQPLAAPVPMVAPHAAHAAAPGSVAASSDDPADHPGAVTSPMVGTVYLQAEPGTAPFISVGDVVKEGQTLVIVEAMKTMNMIPAPRAGTVKRILVDDGSVVEFGSPLIILE